MVGGCTKERNGPGGFQMITQRNQLRLSRRSAITLLIGGGTTALLAACVGQNTPSAPVAPTQSGSSTPQPQTALQATAQPKSGGTLRMGVLGDLQNLDGHVTTGTDTRNRIWNTLTGLDEALNPLPELAERFELSQDALHMRLALRQGVQFHTGREFTSDDVVWNFNRLKDPKVNPIYANLVKPFVTVQNPDKYTVTVDFDAPNPFVVDALPALPMIDPVTFEQSGPSVPVGTGPYKFVEWVQGDHLTLKRHEHYWDSGKPYLDGVEVKIFSDPQAMIGQYEAGVLDVAIQPA